MSDAAVVTATVGEGVPVKADCFASNVPECTVCMKAFLIAEYVLVQITCPTLSACRDLCCSNTVMIAAHNAQGP